MNYKRITMFLSVFILLLIAISSVNATDVSNDTIQIDDTMDTEQTQSTPSTSKEILQDHNTNIEDVEKTIKSDSDGITYTADNYADLISKVNNAKTANNEVIISLNPGDYNATAAITWGGSSNKKLTIDGNGIVLDGQDKYKFITIQANNYLTLKNITIQNYKSSGQGGAIQCLMGQINMDNCTFINNTATDSVGGAVNIQDFTGKQSTVNNTIFIANKAASSGGALNINMANVMINNTKFINNTVTGSSSYGGAIQNYGPSTAVYNSVFEGNNNSNNGGAIYTDNKMTISNVTFKDNYAQRQGGAIYFGNNALNITDSNFINNSAGTLGGSLAGAAGDLIVTNTNFTQGNAQTGGAIYSNGATVILENNLFKDISSLNETLNIPNSKETRLTSNTYDNCSIAGTFTISSESDGQTLTINTPVTISLKEQLLYPDYYDADLINQTKYQIFVNNENKYNTTGSEFTFTTDVMGEQIIYAYSPTLNKQSNEITINVDLGYELVVENITTKIGDMIDITAKILYNGEEVTNISAGKIVFKVNGVTIKNSTTGKVLYVKVSNAKAVIEDFEVPDSWNKENLTISAVYSGSSKCDSLRSDKSTITITTIEETTITTDDITATQGETITLKATVKAGSTIINEGKVVFKVNGKTVKDASGKVIYLNVKNGEVSVDYTIASSMKAKDYKITAVYISPRTDRIEDVKTLTVLKG